MATAEVLSQQPALGPPAVVGASGGPALTKLPAHVQYADPSYWDKRYKLQPSQFDWFYGWCALRKLVKAMLPRNKKLLQIGCGNSNLQEGMAEAGFHVVNVDISQVVVDHMRERAQQQGLQQNLEYLVADCRDMHQFSECHFGGALDKGTVDALLCSKDGVDSVHRMFQETARVLQPGGTFLIITLGDPAHRLPLVCRPDYGWSVSVILLPRVPPEEMVEAEGRPLAPNDTKRPVKYQGPFPVDPATYEIAGMPPLAASTHFFCYVCRKAPLQLQDAKQPRTLPDAWVASSRRELEALAEQMGVRCDMLKRGKRTRKVPMSEFLAEHPEHAMGHFGGTGHIRCSSASGSGSVRQHSGESRHLRHDHHRAERLLAKSQSVLESVGAAAAGNSMDPGSGDTADARAASSPGRTPLLASISGALVIPDSPARAPSTLRANTGLCSDCQPGNSSSSSNSCTLESGALPTVHGSVRAACEGPPDASRDSSVTVLASQMLDMSLCRGEPIIAISPSCEALTAHEIDYCDRSARPYPHHQLLHPAARRAGLLLVGRASAMPDWADSPDRSITASPAVTSPGASSCHTTVTDMPVVQAASSSHAVLGSSVYE
mmetsp:Transcript_30612/g.78136  ORF Transcript_30612/g.78136 Transcript_30612/m.78136 type:complete len:604 (-) Transcript_30612:311-2122(-)|eukprot:CAMPEP_0202860694 /NCGR_PEP_ID=MMETSP1391-20130828/2321_1 /ASSEMBLY_ACC=CAM_ASM_000867 /TAXON_ID=1034604 /ORGANISM="Chlamydomonas leiostraca, Strain SAG 11-49" /LENGTH=603 /DNA_ID=CAMNT_0049539919 /DNA_START=83 /DNA_END=1894 /DNA_ORIENTATION=+